MKLNIIDTAHHRNGITGAPFDVALFEDSGPEGSRKVAILFDGTIPLCRPGRGQTRPGRHRLRRQTPGVATITNRICVRPSPSTNERLDAESLGGKEA